ncbi:MAG: spermidine/putrescine ABC transporter substrate-binding protein [Chloroflexota bacterium]
MSKRWMMFTVLAVLLVAGCGRAAPTPEAEATQPAAVEPARELQLFNWTEYIDPEIYTLFEEEYGIRVVENNFASNEEMLAKLQGGATGYDVIFPSDYTVSIMIEEGMLAPLDHSRLSNLGNLGERFRQVPYDPGNVYCIPYQWGTTGLGYNASEVDEPQSWSVLFEPDPQAPWYGRTTMLDDPREAFGAALAYLGYSVNTTDEAQLQQARDLLIQAKPGLLGYDSDQYEDLLAAGETLVAHGWNGDILMGQAENPDLAYTVPSEGGVIWIDNMCIPSTTPPDRALAAHLFIDFILRPDIGAMVSEFTYFATPNQAAEGMLSEELLTDPAVYPPDEVVERLQFLEPLGELESVYQRMWDEVKAAQ